MESKKPKLFISQPMQGKSIEEIFAEREEAAKKATSLVKRDMEVIDSYIQDAPEGAKPLWFLGKSLELMSDADVVYFAEGWQKARGCQLEYECARAYADDDFVYYEHEPRWIPCAERLPSDENKVLCCTQTKAGAKNIVLGYYAGGKWRCGMNSNVVAWKPLPEVYKED